MMEKPKKERRFLKTLGRVGEILIQEVLLKVGSNLIKRIGGKKTLPSILILFLSISLFAQFPTNTNKQRLGFQTTADGLVWRGSLSDTTSIQPVSNQNAWVILDTVNLKIYSFDFTSNVWNALPQGTNIDTTSLSNRIDLKVNISDTAAMLLPYFKDADTTLLNLVSRFALKLNISDTSAMLANYATKAYADTSGRFYARQDFTNVSSSTLTWTQSDTLVVGGVNVVQVYRNGQILLPTQYTIPTNASVIIGATAFKVGENYTVIFPRGGGAGSGGGSGSLTSISGGTGIIVNPNPITTTGTVSADLSVLMELTDTSLLNLTTRFATKQNTLVSGTNIKTINSNNLLGSGNISVGTLVGTDTVSLSNRINTKLNPTDTVSLSNRINLKLNPVDTISLSNRINAKGTGTVTSIATGYGLSGGTITTAGTLLLDSAVVFTRIRDSIVDVAIGNDTIKILKQEYQPASSSVLTWTITPKFPIQLKAYILVFRNGQLLNNDQYNLTDTNKITIVSTSFKIGANYTVATVSGIGSIGTGIFPNPIYPEAGIALSTGSAWASSITNNSANWNIAYNDKINNAAFSGTTTKTLTLTQLDGGTITPTFTDLQGVTAVTAGTGLTGGTISTTGTVAVDFGVVAPLANPTFTGTVGGITKSMVGLGNVDNTSDANKPISSATQTALNLKENTITAGTSGQYYRGDKTFQTLDKTAVGLGNVDNTSDANKPISSATQTALNLKQNTLNGTGFVKASMTNITYDNSSYLRTGLADSTYLKLTGGTLTGALNVSAAGAPLTVNSTNSNTYKFNLSSSGVVDSYFGSNNVKLFSIADKNVNELFFIDTLGKVSVSATGVPININSINNNFYKLSFSNTNSGVITSYLGSDASKSLSIADNSANEVAYITYLGDAAFNGNITEAGNNVLTNLDTVSLSNRINGKVSLTGNETINGVKTFGSQVNMSGQITLSGSVSGTNRLLGKNTSNNGVGDITVGSGLNLTSDVLNVNSKITNIDTSQYSITSTDVYVDNKNSSSTTIILPLAGLNVFRELKFKNSSTGALIANGDIIPLSGSGTTTTILPATNAKWCTLVSDGTNWIIMQSN